MVITNNQSNENIYELNSVNFNIGTIINLSVEQLITEFYFHCFPCDNKILCRIKTSNKYNLVVPNYISNNNKIFTGIVNGDKNIPSTDDDYIRVKLHFDNSNNDNFIKVRLSHRNSGENYGSWSIPRGGQEVVIMFLDDLLCYAILLGSLYSKDIKPHYYDNKISYKTYFRSETIGNNGQKNKDNFYANELFIDDTKNEEMLRISARLQCEFLITKILKMIVNEQTNIHLKTTKVETETFEIIDTKGTIINSYSNDIKIKKNYSLRANDTSIKTINDTEINSNAIDIKANNSLKIKSNSIDIDANKININTLQFNIKCGSTSLSISPSGIQIKSPIVTYNVQVYSLSSTSMTLNANLATIISPTFTLQGSNNTIIGLTNVI